jgi:DNA polymerase IV
LQLQRVHGWFSAPVGLQEMRTIIHIDMDCFYAAIEIRDQPDLRGKAVAVGGAHDRRGVLTTCNYEARRFGVRSAMPTFLALKKCPQLIVLPTRFEVYEGESRRIREIFRRYTPLVEPLSLDEAYLDVSGDPRGGWSIASEIRGEILAATGLTASAGIGPNKLIAKIASDWEKPDGQFSVGQAEVTSFMAPLPVGRIWGVGPVAAERLERRGIRTCGDLQRQDPRILVKMFGRFGWELYELSRGIDRRPVEPFRARKSLSTEHTFSHDLTGLDACRQQLQPLVSELMEDLAKRKDRSAIQRLFVKLKFADFSKTSVERAGSAPSAAVYDALLAEGFERGGQAVRLIGVGVRFAEGPEQMELPLRQRVE